MPNSNSEKIALILVDIQNDFLDGGSLEVPNSKSILNSVNNLIHQVKAKNGLIVATKDWHPQDHVSFASNHPNKKVFEPIEIEHEGTKVTQVLWPDHCVQGSKGSDIAQEIDLKDIDVIVEKGINRHVDSYSAFADNNYSQITPLAKILYQHFIETVMIVGLATDYCIKYTCIDAVKFGFKTWLVADCTKPVNQDDYETVLEELKSKGVVLKQYSDNFFSSQQK